MKRIGGHADSSVMTFTAAVVQAGSVVMDRDACIEKALELIREAGKDCSLVATLSCI